MKLKELVLHKQYKEVLDKAVSVYTPKIVDRCYPITRKIEFQLYGYPIIEYYFGEYLFRISYFKEEWLIYMEVDHYEMCGEIYEDIRVVTNYTLVINKLLFELIREINRKCNEHSSN